MQTVIKSRLYSFNVIRSFTNEASYLSEQRLRQAYSLLDLNEDATIEEVRESYSHLVKHLHPDTGSEKADPEKLEHVRNAYKLIVKTISNENEEQEEDDEKDFGIRHTAPQHRQYLEYGGVGSGNPYTRMKQYQQYRVSNALENVREFTIEKTIRETQDPKNKDLIAVNQEKKRQRNRLTGMLDRVVEDMILSSMNNGNFQNLKGSGKPLKMDESNPYIDSTQLRVNRILRDNGFSPPWIVKENEVRKSLTEYRERICNELATEIVLILNTSSIDETLFLNDFGDNKITNLLSNKQFIDNGLIEVNKLIQNYNLIAPTMERQFMPLQKERELQRAKKSVLNDFPNSPYIVEAKKRFEKELSKEQKQNEAKGFFQNLLNRFY